MKVGKSKNKGASMSKIIFENENIEELQEDLENLVSKMKNEVSEILYTLKVLIKHNEFECAQNMLIQAFQNATIGNNYENIMNLLKRLTNENN